MGDITGPLADDQSNEQPKPKGLVSKLAEVMAEVGWIKKTGYNEFHRYNYAQEADLVDAIRGELAKRNVIIFPNVSSCQRVAHEVETLKWDENARAKVPTIRKTQLTEIIVEWTFVDGETGQERTIKVPGVGEDNVDKGFYKAFTGSEKYMLMKTFLIPTGDDPEKDSKEDLEEARKQGKQAAQAVAEAKIKAYRAKDANALLYSLPERFNGHFAEFINIAAYLAAHEDQSDSIRMAMTAHGATKTKDETAKVPAEKLPALLEKLAGDLGVTVKELRT